MKATKSIVYKLELNDSEYNAIKDCIDVFLNQGLNEKITGKLGLAKLSSSEIITLTEVEQHLEVLK